MKKSRKKLLSLDKVSVVHLNAIRGYLTYLEGSEDGEYKVKGVLLTSDSGLKDKEKGHG